MKLMLLALLCLAQNLAAQQDNRARIFIDRGCTECHAVTALKVRAQSDVGPDLTYAYGDVRTRYGLTLERFFEQPVDVMRFLLLEHVQLSQADRDVLTSILRTLYFERVARRRDEPGHAHHQPVVPFNRRGS